MAALIERVILTDVIELWSIQFGSAPFHLLLPACQFFFFENVFLLPLEILLIG
jgi:hypothetical protein